MEVRSVSDRLLSSSVGVESPLVSRELLEHVITIMAFTSLILVSPYCQSPLTLGRNKQRNCFFSNRSGFVQNKPGQKTHKNRKRAYMLRKTGHNPGAGCDKNRIYLLDTIRYHDPLCCHLLRIQPGLVAGIVQPLSMSYYCDVTFLLKQRKLTFQAG